MKNKPVVSVILVTRNGAEYMDGLCSSLLKALEASSISSEIIAVDNCSSDATVDIIRGYFTPNPCGAAFFEAKVFTLNKNIGFSRACNLGAKKACGEYLFFLNQDTEVAPWTIKNLLKAAQRRRDAGLLGAKMKFASSPEIINSFGHTMNSIGFAWDYGIGERDSGKFDKERECLGVCGGALFIKRELFLSLGGFDENFFMYGEDVDLGIRVLEAGYKILAVPDAVVFHHKDIFSGSARHFEFLDQKNRWRIVLKNFPHGLLGKAIRGGIRFDLISLSKFLARCEPGRFYYRLMAILYTIFSVPQILSKRRNRDMDILSREMPALITGGRSYPEVDLHYLISKHEWSIGRALLKEGIKKEIHAPGRILLLRGPQPDKANEVRDIIKELYPDSEIVMLVGDNRTTGGFKGNILDISYEGHISYFFKLWAKTFKEFDVILILRKDALSKKILAMCAFPRAIFTIDNVGELDRVTIWRVMREANLAGFLYRSFRQFLKRSLLRIICFWGEIIFPFLGMRREKTDKILLIQLGQIGDLVLETAAVEALKNKFKKAKIVSLVGPWGEELVRRDGLIDKVIVYNAKWLRPGYMSDKKGRGLLRTLIALWREKIDITVDFRGEANSIILAYLSGARLRLGYSIRSENAFLPLEEIKFLLNLPLEFPWAKRHDFHQVEHNLRLLKKIGVEGNFKPRLSLNKREKIWAKTLLPRLISGEGIEGAGPLVIVHPGASRIEKAWSFQKFSKLIRKLQDEYKARVVLIGDKTEIKLGKKIVSSLKEKPLMAVGKTTLSKLTALISKADLFIGNESGPMHIASALAIPTIAIMSGVPSLYGPYKTKCCVVQKKLPCWHPWIEHCYCPEDRYQCLKEIEVEDVWKGVKELIAL